MKVLKTDGITLTISDSRRRRGTLEVNPPVVSAPLKMVFDNERHRVEQWQRRASSSRAASVSLNNGALEVI